MQVLREKEEEEKAHDQYSSGGCSHFTGSRRD